MVLNPVAGHDLRAEHLELLLVGTRPMQPGGDQDQSSLARNPRLSQDLEHRPQDRLVGDGTRNVAYQDASILPPAGNFTEPRAADRLLKRESDGSLGVLERGHVADRQWTDHALGGQLHSQPCPPVIERHSQRLHRASGSSRKWLLKR